MTKDKSKNSTESKPTLGEHHDELQKSLFDNSIVGIGRSTIQEGRIIDANQAMAGAFGYDTLEEFKEQFILQDRYADPEMRQLFVAMLMEKGEINNLEVPFIKKNGDILWSLSSIRCFPDRGFNEFIGIDITEKKRADEALKESENRFRELAEMLPEIVFETDLMGTVTFVNQSAYEISGYSPEDLKSGVGVMQLFVPSDQALAAEKMRRAIEDDMPLAKSEYTAVRKDGSTFPVLAQSSRITRNGKTVGFRGILFDISDRKKAEQELTNHRDHLEKLVEGRTSELHQANRDLENQVAERKRAEETLATHGEWLNTVLRNIGEGVFALNKDNGVVLTNPLAEEYLDALAHDWKTSRLETLGDHPMAELLAPPADGAPYHEIVIEKPHQRFFEMMSSELTGCGEANGWVINLRDVTVEREIRSHSESRDRLAAVGQLAAGIAHDFNNVLFGMMGYTQLLMMMPGMPQGANERLEKVLESGELAARMIRQILDFGRKSPAQKKPVPPVELCQTALNLIEHTLPSHISITLEIETDEQLIYADKTQFQQMLTNLAVNARDAMSEGGELRLKLKTVRLDESDRPPVTGMSPGEWLALSVSDTGHGIDSEDLPHLFEPFFSTKHPSEGTGLGLAQVYGIVKQHEGFVDVQTTRGKGTTFFIYFPVYNSDTEQPSSNPNFEYEQGSGETILLVDDDSIVLESGTEMIEALGYNVVTARNGHEALVIIDNAFHGISLIVTDMIMPVMGGASLLRALAKRKLEIKVLILTGYPLEKDWQESLEKNVVGWTTKPINIEKLGEMIESALNDAED
jgi:PAS domain S-box-containing protein